MNGLYSAIDLIASGNVSNGSMVFEKNNNMHASEITARFAVSPDLNRYPMSIPRSMNTDPVNNSINARFVIISKGTIVLDMKYNDTNITNI